MKDILKAYTSFTRKERLGLIGLLSLLIILLVVRTTLHYWVKPAPNSTEEKTLAAKWESIKGIQTNTSYSAGTNKTLTKKDGSQIQYISPKSKNVLVKAKLFLFDPNTLDSSGFRRLGLSEKTTAILLHWRAKGKKFYKKEDLKALYTLQPEDYAMLEPYIQIRDTRWFKNDNDSYQPATDVIDLNKADSVTLLHLKGLGPVTVHKIILYRLQNGPFTSIDQLLKIRHFPQTVFNSLKQHLVISDH